jgi:hypothetical protein
MVKRCALTIGILCGLGAWQEARAELVTWKATAIVESVDAFLGNDDADVIAAILSQWPVGTVIEMTYTFETTTAPDAGSPTVAVYYHAIQSAQLRVAGILVASGVPTDTRIVIADNHPYFQWPGCEPPLTPPTDSYNAQALGTPSNLLTFGSYAFYVYGFAFEWLPCHDATELVSTTALTADPPNLPISDSSPWLWGLWVGLDRVASVYARLTSLTRVTTDFSGFFAPVDNLPALNKAKAGAAIPIKFSLGGDFGFDIFEVGSPSLQSCDAGAPVVLLQPAVTAGASGLQYDAETQLYTYVWKTDKAWVGMCVELQVAIKDAGQHSARFLFTK